MRLYNYWRSSSSYRVRLALAHKGLPYDYVPVDLSRGEQHQAAHRARNPSGMVPVLEVAEGGVPRRLGQSMAICEYLEQRFPERPLLPEGALARAQVRALAELVNSGIQPFHNAATLAHVRDTLKLDPRAWAEHFIRSGLAALEAQAVSTAGRFLHGDDFTLADCFLVPQLAGARRFCTLAAGDYPTLLRVEAACLAVPQLQAARPEAQVDARPG